MRFSECPSEADLAAFHRGDLPGLRLDTISDHLEGCPGCEQILDALEGTTDAGLSVVRKAASAHPARPPAQVGEYEILGELGRGGMGVVYKARHVKLNRVVALKMILSGAHAGADELRRFLTEAQAIARLRHPGIVAVHEVGEFERRPFFALEFCSGGGLEKKLAGTPMQPEEAASLLKRLAEAMQAAHEANVIHRDLKPANVLLTHPAADAAGSPAYEPKITDFGLAKKLDEQSKTHTGSVMGTPSYMAPEQAEGKGVGPLADVYALGAILYECLSGRPPFRAATAMETLNQVIGQEPVPPCQLNAKVPRDLETVCLKCLEKDPARRYASAAALADDLGRFLAGEPIHARPVGPLTRAAKWAGRHPAIAALLLLLSLALGTTLASAAWGWQQAEARGRLADDRADVERRARLDADESLRRLRAAHYRSELEAARGDFLQGNLGRMNERLAGTPPELRGWEYDYLRALSRGRLRLLEDRGHNRSGLALSDRYLASGGNSAGVRIWDVATGALMADLPTDGGPVVLALGEVGGAPTLAGAIRGEIALWSCEAGRWRRAGALEGSERFAAREMTFSPDGAYLAVALGGYGTTARLSELRVFETATGRVVSSVTEKNPSESPRADSGFRSPVFSPTGDRLAARVDGVARTWDTAAWRELARGRCPAGTTGLALGQRLYAVHVGRDGAGLWDCAANKPAEASALHKGERWRASGGVALAPGGGRLARASDDVYSEVVHLWDLRTGAVSASLHAGRRPIQAVAVSPDGKRLAAGDGARVALWDLDSTREAVVLPCGRYTRARFTSGQQLTSAGDRTLRTWHVPSGRLLRTVSVPSLDGASALATSPDGRLLAAFGRARGGVWQTAPLAKSPSLLQFFGKADTVEPVATMTLAPEQQVLSAAFSPDGRRFVTGELGGASLWDAGSGRRLSRLWTTPAVPQVAFSPDGSLVALTTQDGAVRLVKPDGTVVRELPCKDVGATTGTAVAFSPDGRRLARSIGALVEVWDVRSGERALTFDGHSANVFAVAYSPDGRRVASGGDDNTVCVWDADTGREAYAPGGYTGGTVLGLEFSPDGRHLAASNRAGDVHVWVGESAEGHASSGKR